jgi:cell division protein FtsW (lipid II flippase)
MIVLSLYLLLARIVIQRLPSVKDEEDQLIAVGILALIVMQAFINVAVNIRLLPLTGLTLPFFSH